MPFLVYSISRVSATMSRTCWPTYSITKSSCAISSSALYRFIAEVYGVLYTPDTPFCAFFYIFLYLFFARILRLNFNLKIRAKKSTIKISKKCTTRYKCKKKVCKKAYRVYVYPNIKICETHSEQTPAVDGTLHKLHLFFTHRQLVIFG